MKYEYAMYHKLMQHFECGFDGCSAIEIAQYGNGENLAIECTKCNEVIFDVDKPILVDFKKDTSKLMPQGRWKK